MERNTWLCVASVRSGLTNPVNEYQRFYLSRTGGFVLALFPGPHVFHFSYVHVHCSCGYVFISVMRRVGE